MAVPVVCVVGPHACAKTAVVEGLVAMLSARGLRVATAKHAHEGFEADRAGTDSARHRAAGAAAVLLAGPEGSVLWRREPGGDRAIAALAARDLGGYDLVIAEGWKGSDLPKIEVWRSERDAAPLAGISGVVARVAPRPAGDAVPWFRPDDLEGLSRFVASRFVAGGGAA